MTIIDKIIFALDHAFYLNLAKVPADMDYPTWKWHCQNAVDAVAWFVTTGRATCAEEKAIAGCRTYYLVRHLAMCDADGASIDALITALKRYPGIKKRLKAWE